MKSGRVVAMALVGLATIVGSARAATMIGQTIDASVIFEGQDDNGFYSIPIFFAGPITVGPGQEISQFFSKQLTQGGFSTASNVLFGTATVNVGAESMTVGFSGQAQPGVLNFNFNTLAFAPPSLVTGISTSETGIMNGVNMANTPTFAASSVNGMGFFLFGYQPGTNVTQTANLALTPIPEPATYLLMLVGLGVVAAMARRRRA